jgi:hypothetical protein
MRRMVAVLPVLLTVYEEDGGCVAFTVYYLRNMVAVLLILLTACSMRKIVAVLPLLLTV